MSDESKEWLIASHEPMEWWSNEIGWVDQRSATRFTCEETKTLALPIDGQWERVCNECDYVEDDVACHYPDCSKLETDNRKDKRDENERRYTYNRV